MKTRTKITLTLAVGMGLLIGSMGAASASPHYTDWIGTSSLKAEVSNVENTKVIRIKDLGRTSGFSHHANVDKVQVKENLSENIKVTIKDTMDPWINVSPVSIEAAVTPFEDRINKSDGDHDMNDSTLGESDIWTTGGPSTMTALGGLSSVWTSGGVTSIWTSGGVTSVWTNGSATSLFANFSPFIF